MSTVDTAIPVLPHAECLEESAKSIFPATCGLELLPSDDSLAVNDGDTALAVISLVGAVEWSVFLALPKATAVGLSAKFAGFEIAFESNDLGDAVGELTNILAGDIKARLDAIGIKANISLPSVMRCSNLQVLIPRDLPVHKLAFTTAVGPMQVGIIAGKKSGQQ